ncbi:MAG: dienelactone hydrolase family protein [Proteobacteria bacterium]|nr:dienelactone hydrolase family protein [Pseudomonadota bacterium]
MLPTATEASERGPHAVGVRTLEIPDPDQPGRVLPTDVWYPTTENGAEEADHPFRQPHRAQSDAPPVAEPLPLVAFSHGNSGLRRQSTFLTTHLASWGFAVVAPDHMGNTFFEMIQVSDDDARKRIHRTAREQRPRDVIRSVDAVADGAVPGLRVQSERYGACGHSFGGWTVTKLPARDARVAAICGLAPASEPFVGRRAYAEGDLPFPAGVPSLIVAGHDDVLVDWNDSILPLYRRLAEPRALIGLADADHFHFCDGIELLHRMHESNPRPGQKSPTRPMSELLDEARTHRILCALVTDFFRRHLQSASTPGGAEAWAELDPAVRPFPAESARDDSAA